MMEDVCYRYFMKPNYNLNYLYFFLELRTCIYFKRFEYLHFYIFFSSQIIVKKLGESYQNYYFLMNEVARNISYKIITTIY